MTRIKLCGLRRPEDMAIVNECGADYAGFILSKPFWRYSAPEKVRELRALLDERVTVVGVFVNEPIEYVAGLLRDGTVDMAQLHGQEDDAYILALKEMTDKPVSKAFRVRTDEDIRLAAASRADYVLLDGGTGTGVAFDWSLIRDIGRPYFLAGGLGPENALEAVERYHPFAVDVSSGIETEKVKDAAKARAFVAAVRQADR